MIRIGFSKDVHKLVPGEILILGGIEIPHYKKSLAHSDGDCLLHAIAEALLGSMALGDLGKHFPDTDQTYKGYDSKLILKESYKLIKEKGYKVSNLDCMISLEKPKLKEYIYIMRETISDLLDCCIEKISIKATTHEGLGFVGREEGILCEAIVIVSDEH